MIFFFTLGTHVATFVGMDAVNGAGLMVNGKNSLVVALGPNINLDIYLSPSGGGVPSIGAGGGLGGPGTTAGIL